MQYWLRQSKQKMWLQVPILDTSELSTLLVHILQIWMLVADLIRDEMIGRWACCSFVWCLIWSLKLLESFWIGKELLLEEILLDDADCLTSWFDREVGFMVWHLFNIHYKSMNIKIFMSRYIQQLFQPLLILFATLFYETDLTSWPFLFHFSLPINSPFWALTHLLGIFL